MKSEYEKEHEKKVERFIDELKELSYKYGLDIGGKIDICDKQSQLNYYCDLNLIETSPESPRIVKF